MTLSPDQPSLVLPTPTSAWVHVGVLFVLNIPCVPSVVTVSLTPPTSSRDGPSSCLENEETEAGPKSHTWEKACLEFEPGLGDSKALFRVFTLWAFNATLAWGSWGCGLDPRSR